ncbi:PhnE/PtxC family ABC transporter permease [Guggenheimella bovis]
MNEENIQKLKLNSNFEKPEEKKEEHDHSRLWVGITLVTLLVLTVVSFLNFDTKGIDLGQASIDTIKNIGVMFGEMGLHHFDLGHAIWQLLITFSLAFLTTFVAAIISFFLSLVAAKNLSNGFWSTIVKGFVAFIRAVPTVLWVLIFAIAAGLGAEAAVIGLSFHAIGYLTKAYSEAFEEMDMGVVEALQATGAGFWQVVFQGVLPTTMSYIIAWTFMRFEINYTAAVAMGAAAGAGGIGFDLFMSGSFYYDMREVGAVTTIILVSVLLLEALSVLIKKHIKEGQ